MTCAEPPGWPHTEAMDLGRVAMEASRLAGLAPEARAGRSQPGELRPGMGRAQGRLDFVVRDHLNLAAHPVVRAAVRQAREEAPPPDAGQDAVRELELRLARFLGHADCALFPSGWAARLAAIAGLAGPGDHILLDEAASPALAAAASRVGARLHGFAHLSNEAALSQLVALRAAAPEAGILLVTESLFAADSTAPDLPGLKAMGRQFGARLLVDVTRDFGVLGEDGRGNLGRQGMLGLADLVTGGFCRGLGGAGGFATARGPLPRPTAGACFQPPHLAGLRAAFEIMVSFEGAARRQRLIRQAGLLREALEAAGFTVPGEPSPILPVLLGPPPLARLMTRHARAAGARLHLMERPGAQPCHWVLQLRADHTPAQLRRMAEIAGEAREWALTRLAAVPAAGTAEAA